MNKTLFKVSVFSFLGLTLLALLSCATPKKTDNIPSDHDLASITTIGLFPITYAEGYSAPLPTDLKGMDLSSMIIRQIEKVLSQKGYKLSSLNFPTEIVEDQNSVPLKSKPSSLAGTYSQDVDGLMQVHVTFHFGINPTERSSDEGPFSRIYLNATAQLFEKNGQKEVWRKSRRSRPLYSANFPTRLNYAVYTLANGLFETFPDKGN